MGKRKTRTADGPVRHLSQPEMRQPLAAAQRRGTRDAPLIGLAYRLGLRASESADLQLGNADLSGDGEIVVRGAKRGVTRRYSFPHDLLRLGRRWIKERGDAPRHFFTSRQGDRLTRQRIWQIVRACADDAKLPRWVTPHVLRHSIGTHLVDSGATLEDVKDLLRHRRIRSSEIYGVTSLPRRGRYLERMEQSSDIVKVP